MHVALDVPGGVVQRRLAGRVLLQHEIPAVSQGLVDEGQNFLRKEKVETEKFREKFSSRTENSKAKLPSQRKHIRREKAA